jgi:hypothetical protein
VLSCSTCSPGSAAHLMQCVMDTQARAASLLLSQLHHAGAQRGHQCINCI